jgi:hypothetical protein
MPKNLLFFLNNYNDVDQAAPLISTLLEEARGVKVICLGHYDLKNDPRIRFFSHYESFVIVTPKYLPTAGRSTGIIQKLWRRIVFNPVFAVSFLKQHKIGLCIYTWCNPTGKGFQTRIFWAAQKLKIKNVCIPHGQNIFLNFDVNQHLIDFHQRTRRWPDFSPRNKFDLYIVQTEHHRRWNIEWGMNPKIIVKLGSMRFHPDWVKKHLAFFPAYKSKFSSSFVGHVKIVFFIPHWHYNVDYENTINLIARLAKSNFIELVIKGHTRGHRLSQTEVDHLKRFSNVEFDRITPSSALIDWSDLVINFGSSIGLEAVVVGKPVINPSYLHKNKTVFDNSGAVYDVNSNDETLEIIRKMKSGTLSESSVDAKSQILSSEVYLDLETADCATKYKDAVLALI